jgi:hypothetical protein
LLQHALGVAFHGGLLYVTDTYNNKIKVIDPKDHTAKTLAGDGKPSAEDQPTARFDEPAGISVAAGKLYVADTNNHLIRVIDLKDHHVSTLTIDGLAPPGEEKPAAAKRSFAGASQVKLQPVTLSPQDGKINLEVELTLPLGWKMNPDAPLKYLVEPAAANGPLDRQSLGKLQEVSKPAARFSIPVPVTAASGEDTVKVSVAYYYCQEGNAGLCKAGSVTWTAPLRLASSAKGHQASLKFDVE